MGADGVHAASGLVSGNSVLLVSWARTAMAQASHCGRLI